MEPREVVIVGGNRVPFAEPGGHYRDATVQELLTAALQGLITRFSLDGELLGEVLAGAVQKLVADTDLTRESVLSTTLSPQTAAHDLQAGGCTGLDAALCLANRIRLGQIESGVAGGADSVSNAPAQMSDTLRRALLDTAAAGTMRERLRILARLRPADVRSERPVLIEPRTGMSTGDHQAITAARWGISRAAQDAYALRSHKRLSAAWESGFFDDLATPLRGLSRDAGVRRDLTAAELATERPRFGLDLAGTAITDPTAVLRAGSPTVTPSITRGNAASPADGAAVVLLATTQWAKARGLPILARVVDGQSAAVDFAHGREGLLMGAVPAVARLLQRTQHRLPDFDLYELHEPFAATVLTMLAAWSDPPYCRDKLGWPDALGAVDPQRLNPQGSTLAAGHPFGATGGRILATAAKQVAARASEATNSPIRALITSVGFGGRGTALIIESVSP